MTTCAERHHPDHVHQHGSNCGHTAIRHDAHVDYLHGGHLHYMHGDHVDEYVIAIGATKIPCTAPPKSGAQAIMAIIATTMGPCGWPDIGSTELSEPFGKFRSCCTNDGAANEEHTATGDTGCGSSFKVLAVTRYREADACLRGIGAARNSRAWAMLWTRTPLANSP